MHTYRTIIIQSCKYNSYDVIKRVYNYIKSIKFDIVHVINVFTNRYFQLFKLLYTLPHVYNASMNSTFIDACAIGQITIVKTMLNNPNINPSYHSNYTLRYAVENNQYEIVKILITNDRIDQNILNNSAFTTAIYKNNIEMIKLLFTDQRININNLNLFNISELIKKPKIFNYILNSDKINYNFINICIYSFLLTNDYDKIFEIIQHQKFQKNTLFPNYDYDHILLSKINLYNIELINTLIDINNLSFIYSLLQKFIINYNNNNNLNTLKLLITFIINKVNNNDYILTTILDILNLNLNPRNTEILNQIYLIINNSPSFFDMAYNLDYYDICKKYIMLPNINISSIFKKFYNGKYNKLAKIFLNFY